MKKLLTLLLITCTLGLTAQQKEITWLTDVEEAIKISLRTEKPLLLFFTGKDWCGPCKMTAKYVFGSQEFAKWSDDFVLVELDFPRGPKRAEIPAQHIEIAQQLQVRSYPTIYFVTATFEDGQTKLNALQPIVGGSKDAKSWISRANQIVKTIKK